VDVASGRESCVKTTGGTTRGIPIHADEKGRFIRQVIGGGRLAAELFVIGSGKEASSCSLIVMTRLTLNSPRRRKPPDVKTVVVRLTRHLRGRPAPSAASATAGLGPQRSWWKCR